VFSALRWRAWIFLRRESLKFGMAILLYVDGCIQEMTLAAQAAQLPR
jgi:hypothetical protein